MSGAAEAAVAAPPKVSATAVFKRRDFALMWVAQLVSTAGSALTDLAAGIYVYTKTGSALYVGMTLMATAVPSLVVGLIAGVFVDRWDRRRVMIVSNLLQAAVVASIPFLIGVDMWLLFVAILLNAGVKMFFQPAYEALIPEIASDEELTAANAFLAIASFGSTAIGFAGAGLLAAIDIRLAFWIDALTFLFSAGCIAIMRVKASVETQDAESASIGLVLANLRLGVRTIATTPMLRSLFLLGAPVFFSFGLWNVLLLPMAIRVLGGTEFQYGVQEGLTSIGFVAGSLFMARFAPVLPVGRWIFVGSIGMGAAGVLYGMAPSISIGIIWVMISGFFNSPSSVSRQTLLQRNTPRELRGRVFSSMFVMRDIIFLAGMSLAGLADIFDVRILVTAASGVLIVVGIISLFAPGIGRPAAEWRRGLVALRASRATVAGTVRAATAEDYEVLVGGLATFSLLSGPQRSAFMRDALVRDLPEGARVVTRGERATAAYFILDGEAAAGVPEEDGGYRGLRVMRAGDFFGEIAALTGSARSADVVAVTPARLLEVPASALRTAMEVPEVSRLVNDTLAERILRTNQPDLPRLASMDQAALRELRTKAPSTDGLPQAVGRA